MKLSQVVLLSAIISLCPHASQAQSQSGGMKTLYVGKEDNTSSIPYTALTPQEAEKIRQEKDALARVLEKYDNMNNPEVEAAQQDAATDALPRQQDALPVRRKEFMVPKHTGAQTPPMPKEPSMATGFASIIKEYKESKENRSKIRTRTITP